MIAGKPSYATIRALRLSRAEVMSNIRNPTAFEDIQELCRSYRRNLRKGISVQLEDYLGRVEQTSREMLFQNLLHIDIEFQRHQGQEPDSAGYVQRFPEYARLVRQAFFESTLMTVNPGVETPADEDTVMFGALPARRLGDYELLRELGRGGFGVVYEARHLKRGDVVALKTLPAPAAGSDDRQQEAERLHRFRREFRSLSEINHPHLVGMQSLEVDGRQWFFTMDVIDGVDFLEYVRPEDRLDEERLRSTLPQLVTGIVALHREGIVHRDLKPGNVFVGADGQVTIMDFGLVAELQAPTNRTVSMKSQQFAGTPRYAAPEQTSGMRAAASDWYALGVMLHEALTGRAPFVGSHVDVVVQKQTQDAPTLMGCDDVPTDLAQLADELLRRDPADRPGDVVLSDRFGLLQDSVSHDSVDSHWSLLTDSSDRMLIGRENQLAQLEQERLRWLETGEPAAVFIRGRSGEGKTALAEKFLQSQRTTKDRVVLAGRCYDRESVPFKAVDCLIDALVTHLRARPADLVRAELPADIFMLVQIFPVLRRVEAIAERCTAPTASVDSRQVRFRAFAALRELLHTIGQGTPVILFVDDLQWGDGDSARVLADLLAPPQAPRVLLLGTYRSDEAVDSAFLLEFDSAATDIRRITVEVSALTRDQCAAMLRTRLEVSGRDVSRHLDQVWQSAQGNPYFLDQMLEGFDPDSGQFRAVSLSELIRQRLDRLPEEAAALLDAVAVAGQAVPLDEVAAVTGNHDRIFATITHMRNERLVRLIGAEDHQMVDTYHDKVRETVLQTMPAERQRSLHLQFAELLEQSVGLSADEVRRFLEQDPLLERDRPPASDRIFDLAFHFQAADDERAFAYLFMAGELSFRAYASAKALEFFERAVECCPADVSPSLRFRLRERLARIRVRLRELEAGLCDFELALKNADTSLQRAHVLELMGEADVSRSDYQAALEHFDRALNELGLPRPRGMSAMIRCIPEVLRILARPPKWDDKPDGSAYDRARFGIYLRALNSTFVYIFELSGGIASYLYFLLRAQTAARFIAGTEFWGKTVTHSAGQIALNGSPWLARRLLTNAEAATEAIHDPEMKGFFLTGSALANQFSGDRRLADRQYAEGYQLLQKTGSHHYVGPVAHLHRHLHAVIAASSVELESAQRTLRAGKATEDRRTQCWGHYDIASALARAGDIETALLEIEQARLHLKPGERYVTDAIFLCTEGYVRLQASSYAAARFSLEAAWQLTRQRKLLMDVVVRCVPYLIESLLGPNWMQPVSRPLSRRLRRLCRVAVVIDRLYPNIASPAQRSLGRAYTALGSRSKAVRCFRKAIRRAEVCHAGYDRARSLLDLAAVEDNQRDQRRIEAIGLLQQLKSVLPRDEAWLLGDVTTSDAPIAAN
ncbi:MAG: hypothetical protein Fues2KO_27650 [Fuerstiella sp.]